MDILSGIQKKVYAVIEFTTEGEVEIVASKWLFLTNKTQLNVYWPPGPSFETRRMCINQNQPIPGVWKIFEVQIIHITGRMNNNKLNVNGLQFGFCCIIFNHR